VDINQGTDTSAWRHGVPFRQMFDETRLS